MSMQILLAEATRVLVNQEPGLPVRTLLLRPDSMLLDVSVDTEDDCKEWAKALQQGSAAAEVLVNRTGPFGDEETRRYYFYSVLTPKKDVQWSITAVVYVTAEDWQKHLVGPEAVSP